MTSAGPAWDHRVHRITAIWDWESIVEVYFINGPARALIDTGASDTPRRYIAPVLHSLGLRLSDVDYIINTHGHLDHMGGNHNLQAQGRAQVLVHRDDARLLEDLDYHTDYIWYVDKQLLHADLSARKANFMHIVTGPSQVHRHLEDGDVIDLGDDIQLRVVHLPGHSPGSLGLYWEAKKMVFVGDSVQGRGSRTGGFPLYYLAREYQHSLRRLAAMDVEILVMAHRYLWTKQDRDAVHHGEDVCLLLEESLRVATVIDQAVRDAVQAEGADAGFLRVAQRATKSLMDELAFYVNPRTGLPAVGYATLFSHYRVITGKDV
jgi:glyoxylase-like metal-dependent hydrolase (beta-lactamase superfamily II)